MIASAVDVVLAVTICLGVYGQVLGECPHSFEIHGDRCYKVLDLAANWVDAKDYCKLFGADLAVIESQAEESLVEGILQKYKGTASNHLYWINGGDMLSENEWRWFDGQPGTSRLISGYFHWSPGQPDNAGSTEHCLEIALGFGLKWNDRPCTNMNSFICESGDLQ